MMIKFVIRNTDRLNKALEQKRSKVKDNLVDRINGYVDLLYDKIIGKLSGSVLHRRSGKLIRSVQKVPASAFRDNLTGGYVTQDLRVAPYGAVHEKGGVKKYEIVPKNKAIMFWMTEGTKVSFMAKGKLKEFARDRKFAFARIVHRDPLEKRSFMASALDEMRPEILQGIGTVVRSK